MKREIDSGANEFENRFGCPGISVKSSVCQVAKFTVSLAPVSKERLDVLTVSSADNTAYECRIRIFDSC